MRASAGISDAVLNNAVAAKPVKPAFRMLLMRGFLAEGRHYANLVSESPSTTWQAVWLFSRLECANWQARRWRPCAESASLRLLPLLHLTRHDPRRLGGLIRIGSL